MKRSLAAVAAMTAAVIVAACSSKSVSSSPCGFVSAGVGPTVQFHVDSGCQTNPFPSDVLRNGGTVSIPEVRVGYEMPYTAVFATAHAFVASTLASLDSDGFSPLAPIIIPMSHPVNAATATSAGVLIFTLTTGSNPVVTRDHHVLDPSWDNDFSALLLQPDTPLEEQTQYGIVITTAVTDSAGQPTNRSPDFEDLVKGIKGKASPEILALIAAAGVPADQVSLAFTFRTQSITPGLASIASQIFGSGTVGSSLLPQYNAPETNTELSGLVENSNMERGTALFGQVLQGDAQLTTADVPNLGVIATGSFDAWKFRDSPTLPFNPAYVSGASLGPTEHIEFRVTIPQGIPPPGGWPVILFQHGLGGSSVDVYSIGDVAALYGFATIGTEAVAHGRRGDVFSFFNWTSINATRDNFRESVADDLQLLRLVRNAGNKGAGPFQLLNTDDVTYMGISLGGILGGTFTALAPGVPGSALVVPGGHLSGELTAVAVGEEYLWPFIAVYSGINPNQDQSDFLVFVKGFDLAVQMGLDGGDPANFGVHVLTPGRQLPGVEAKHVIIQESKGDDWVPNPENEALRRAMGISVVDSAVSGSQLSLTWVYTTGEFPVLAGDGEPHGWWGDLCNERVQTFTWIQTRGDSFINPAATLASNQCATVHSD